MAKACIICYQEKDGLAVRDDAVIRAIRSVKQRLNVAKNNKLVVCGSCLEEYRKKRKKYERDLIVHIVLAGIVLILFVLAPIFTAGFSITATILGLALAALVVALSVFSHCPAIDGGENAAGGEEEAKKKARKR